MGLSETVTTLSLPSRGEILNNNEKQKMLSSTSHYVYVRENVLISMKTKLNYKMQKGLSQKGGGRGGKAGE